MFKWNVYSRILTAALLMLVTQKDKTAAQLHQYGRVNIWGDEDS